MNVRIHCVQLRVRVRRGCSQANHQLQQASHARTWLSMPNVGFAAAYRNGHITIRKDKHGKSANFNRVSESRAGAMCFAQHMLRPSRPGHCRANEPCLRLAIGCRKAR